MSAAAVSSLRHGDIQRFNTRQIIRRRPLVSRCIALHQNYRTLYPPDHDRGPLLILKLIPHIHKRLRV